MITTHCNGFTNVHHPARSIRRQKVIARWVLANKASVISHVTEHDLREFLLGEELLPQSDTVLNEFEHQVPA